jgi:hypothetical protein
MLKRTRIHMQFIPQLDDLLAGLVSTDLEVQASALEIAAALLESVVHSAIQGYENSTNPTVTAERLLLLGPAIVPPLEQFITDKEAGEKRTIASLLLISLGSMKGLEDVLEAVRSGSDNQFLAAHKLANAGVTQAVDLIIVRLRSLIATDLFNRESAPKFASFLSALRRLNVALPSDVREQLLSPTVPKEITQVLKQNNY